MSTELKAPYAVKPAYRTERIIASLVMAWVLGLTSYMIFQDRALSEASMYFLKILLSMSGAVMLATLPGFFDINYSVGGLSIRAAGGAAAFVFIYTQSPNLPAMKSTVVPYAPIEKSSPGRVSGVEGHRVYDGDGTPVLVALSLDPSSVTSKSAVALVDANGPGSPPASDGGNAGSAGGSGGDSSGSRDGGILEGARSAISAWIGTLSGKVVQFAQSAKAMLDRIATGIRGAVGWTGGKLGAFVGRLWPDGAASVPQIQALLADMPGQVENIANAAIAPAVGAVGDLAIKLEATPAIGGVRETVQDVPGVVNGTVAAAMSSVKDITGAIGDTLATTTHSAHELVTGLLQSPDTAVARAGEAVEDVKNSLLRTTASVAHTAKDLANDAGAQIATVTDKLNDISPALISRLDPKLADLAPIKDAIGSHVGDLHAVLPPLSALGGSGAVRLPQGPLAGDRPSGEHFGRSEEISGGCSGCLLPPLNVGSVGAAAGLNGGSSGLGGKLSPGGAAAVSGSGGGSEGGGAATAGAGGSVAAGGGGGNGGPVAGIVGAAGSAVGGLTRGLRGRH